MKKKIIITAANGFLGKALLNFMKDEYEVIALVRNSCTEIEGVTYRIWDGKQKGKWFEDIDGAYAIINLAGRSVDCRYNEENKQAILNSRLESTSIIAQAISASNIKPKVWINSASATIYRHSLDMPMTEQKGENGKGFSVEVCESWEKCFYSNSHLGVRQIALRTAIVLGSEGGVMVPFKNLVRLGLGGKMGNGNQMFSWIHIHDFCRAVDFLLKNEASQGSYNISSPNPITNAVFMKSLRKQIGISFGLPLKKWILELGAFMIKTETELILKSRYVIPEKLIQEGFQFKYKEIDQALNEIL